MFACDAPATAATMETSRNPAAANARVAGYPPATGTVHAPRSPMAPGQVAGRHSLQTPWLLSQLEGSVPQMGRLEALKHGRPGTKVLVLQRGKVFAAEIRAVDPTGSNVAIRFPAWPDESEQWISNSSIFTLTSTTESIAASIGDKLAACYSSWAGFQYTLGQQVTVRCGHIARFRGTVQGRCLRQFDAQDLSRDNPMSDFIPMYIVSRRGASSPVDATVAPIYYYEADVLDELEDASLTASDSESEFESDFEQTYAGETKKRKNNGLTALNKQRRKRRTSGQPGWWPGSDTADVQHKSSVCKACKFGAHSAHTCGTRGTGTKQDRVTAPFAASSSLISVSERARKSSEEGGLVFAAYATRNSGIRVRKSVLSGQSLPPSPSARTSSSTSGLASLSSSGTSPVSPSPPRLAGPGRTVQVQHFGRRELIARDFNTMTDMIPIPYRDLNPASRRQGVMSPPRCDRPPAPKPAPRTSFSELFGWAAEIEPADRPHHASTGVRRLGHPKAQPTTLLRDLTVALQDCDSCGGRVPAEVAAVCKTCDTLEDCAVSILAV